MPSEKKSKPRAASEPTGVPVDRKLDPPAESKAEPALLSFSADKGIPEQMKDALNAGLFGSLTSQMKKAFDDGLFGSTTPIRERLADVLDAAYRGFEHVGSDKDVIEVLAALVEAAPETVEKMADLARKRRNKNRPRVMREQSEALEVWDGRQPTAAVVARWVVDAVWIYVLAERGWARLTVGRWNTRQPTAEELDLVAQAISDAVDSGKGNGSFLLRAALRTLGVPQLRAQDMTDVLRKK